MAVSLLFSPLTSAHKIHRLTGLLKYEFQTDGRINANIWQKSAIEKYFRDTYEPKQKVFTSINKQKK